MLTPRNAFHAKIAKLISQRPQTALLTFVPGTFVATALFRLYYGNAKAIMNPAGVSLSPATDTATYCLPSLS